MHDLRLTESADLWYLGGGAFDARVFGYTGRPSSASTSLATVTDLSIAWQAHKRLVVELYGAAAPWCRAHTVARATRALCISRLRLPAER